MADVGTTLRPDSEDALRDAIAQALADEAPVEIVGGGSKRAFGPPLGDLATLDLSALSGIVLYEPEELVLSARPGTRVSEIEAALAAHNQRLAFAPPDLGPLLGAAEGLGSIGGIVACNLAGSARLTAGAARDHLIGVRAVSGRGELFKSGGRVVKNVTGYDLSKLLAGSYGTLAAISEVTLRVVPTPEAVRTLLVVGPEGEAAIGAMTRALQSPHAVVAAAHMPKAAAAGSSVSYVRDAAAPLVALRIEGFRPSVLARCEALKDLMADWGTLEELHRHNSEILWREIGAVGPLLAPGDGAAVWRLSVPPSDGASVAAEIESALPVRALYDWGGGLVWLALDEPEDDAGAQIVRQAAARTGGYATLFAAPEAVRAAVPAFPPQPAPLAALTRRLKQAFDPTNILNPGRLAGPD